MKKILLLTTLIMCGISVPAIADTISIEPSSSIVVPGQSFSVEIRASAVSDLLAFQFDVGFNPGVLSATFIAEGSFLPSGGATLFIPGLIDNATGLISFTGDTLLTSISGVTGSGTLARIQFTAAGSSSSPIALSNVVLLDSTLSVIPVSVVNGSTTVVPEPASWTLLIWIFPLLILVKTRHPSR